jgi:hypothetical protein
MTLPGTENIWCTPLKLRVPAEIKDEIRILRKRWVQINYALEGLRALRAGMTGYAYDDEVLSAVTHHIEGRVRVLETELERR